MEMSMFTEEKIQSLDEIAGVYGCELLLPPAQGINTPFFDVSDLRFFDQIAFRNFMIEVDNVVGSYEIVESNGKCFVVIND